ncbi:hypothetical protein B0H13DRAFT_882993 [Mycena leptocephala]|nr:hypothetical protein B0H13DRAFT_882993 [Mycena leptocephala]
MGVACAVFLLQRGRSMGRAFSCLKRRTHVHLGHSVVVIVEWRYLYLWCRRAFFSSPITAGAFARPHSRRSHRRRSFCTSPSSLFIGSRRSTRDTTLIFHLPRPSQSSLLRMLALCPPGCSAPPSTPECFDRVGDSERARCVAAKARRGAVGMDVERQGGREGGMGWREDGEEGYGWGCEGEGGEKDRRRG